MRRWSSASIGYHAPGKSENKRILLFRSDDANKQTTKLLSAQFLAARRPMSD
jgi:hypothetical protein